MRHSLPLSYEIDGAKGHFRHLSTWIQNATKLHFEFPPLEEAKARRAKRGEDRNGGFRGDALSNIVIERHARPDIEGNIQRTREIESEIVECSEIEKDLLIKESEYMKMIIGREFEMNGLIQVAAVANSSLELMKKELSCLRRSWEGTQKRMTNCREKFIVLCGDFQQDIVKGETDELRALLLEKEVLENEKSTLNMKINALGNSTSAYVEDTLEELRNSSSVLQVEMHCQSLENEKLLKDIDDLKNSLLALE